MSKQYPGGFITKDYVAPTPAAALGIWTLDQQLQAQKTGTWPFGGPFNYIEDVFSTYLYTGNGATQTINNGIDLAGKGGLVWLKSRNAATNHFLFDTTRGALNELNSNTTDAQASLAASLTAFSTTGFSLGAAAGINVNADNFASWTFREQPKFFDVVTYTGNGVAGRTVAHNLGSVPGCIIVKRTDAASTEWWVYHRSVTPADCLALNTTLSSNNYGGAYVFGNDSVPIAPTSTVFTVASDSSINASGGTYVAYLFAHNAGGFGLTGTDNVISCGSYTGNGSSTGPVVTLGYEPQWVLIKNTTTAQSWWLFDNMRGMSLSSDEGLNPNTSGTATTVDWVSPTATGFQIVTTSGGANTSGDNYIYIAIRRGPMKVPTDATKVFNTVSQTPSGTTTVTNSFASDMVLSCQRSNGGGWGFNVADKLRGSSIASGSLYLTTPTSAAEGNFSGFGFNLTNTNVQENFWNSALGISTPVVYDMFQRAPQFFDVVCYTGTGVARTINHNLTVVPELMIVKNRTGTDAWYVTGAAFAVTEDIVLNSTAAKATNAANRWNSTRPTASVFSVGTGIQTNDLGDNYVWYGFATCAGVSKCGSYTGNGTTQTIDCGFAAGARFVLIKRTDSTGGWYVYDTARGMTTLTDPYLFLNSTAAEVATLGSVTTGTTGFALNSAILADINVSGGTYIFLAIA